MTFDEKIIHIGKSANGKILSEWLRDNGYMILQPCGGRGTCGKCLVKVINGVFFNVSDGKYAEPDENGCVKACQSVCTAGGGADIQLSLHEASGLTVKHETENIKNCSFTTIRKKRYSAAFDIGTTTLAMALVDLDSGNIIDSKSCLNPQHSYGADVISRISACSNGFLDQLRACALSAANSMLNSLLYGRADSAEEITVAGNTTMLHIFCGISPVSMGTYPFSPVFKDLKIFSGDSFGLRAKKVTVLPSVSAFIGADIVSGLVFTQLDRSKTPALFIDIGTNGEMVLWSGEKLISASAAAGPALEGGNISCGTGGIPGAVCKVYEKSEGIVFKTICDKESSGICGSGLIDLISIMLNRHILDETGSLDSENFRLCGIHEKKICSLYLNLRKVLPF